MVSVTLNAPVNGGVSAAGNGSAASSEKGPDIVEGASVRPTHAAADYIGGQTGTDSYRKRKITMMPLEVGTRVNCRWRDGKYHPVKVIERRKLPVGDPNDYEYYVHYTECEK